MEVRTGWKQNERTDEGQLAKCSGHLSTRELGEAGSRGNLSLGPEAVMQSLGWILNQLQVDVRDNAALKTCQ